MRHYRKVGDATVAGDEVEPWSPGTSGDVVPRKDFVKKTETKPYLAAWIEKSPNVITFRIRQFIRPSLLPFFRTKP